MEPRKHEHLNSPGLAFLSAGVAFMAMALSNGQNAFIGVGAAFVVLGMVFLGKSRRRP